MNLSKVNRSIIIQALNRFILDRKGLLKFDTDPELKVKLEGEINRARVIIHMMKNL